VAHACAVTALPLASLTFSWICSPSLTTGVSWPWGPVTVRTASCGRLSRCGLAARDAGAWRLRIRATHTTTACADTNLTRSNTGLFMATPSLRDFEDGWQLTRVSAPHPAPILPDARLRTPACQ